MILIMTTVLNQEETVKVSYFKMKNRLPLCVLL